jgi:heterodisulfide reductase subunit C2
MDIRPAQIMHSIRLGRIDSVLTSQAIWLCIGCEICSARCPQNLNPSAVMVAARLLAISKGYEPSMREVRVYYRGFVDNMRLNGKIHDASVVAVTSLLNKRLLTDAKLAWKLLLKGRIKPPPLPLGGRRFRKLYKYVMASEKEAK